MPALYTGGHGNPNGKVNPSSIVAFPRSRFQHPSLITPLPPSIHRRYRQQLTYDSLSTMRKVPCAFYGEVSAHYQPIVTLFGGPQAWDRAIAHRRWHGRGSVLVLEFGQDASHLLWPLWDRIITINWPNVAPWRLKQLTWIFLEAKADLVVGVDRTGELVLERRKEHE